MPDNKFMTNQHKKILTAQAGQQSIEARYEDETIWLPQKLMASLFDVNVRAINEHIQNIDSQQALTLEATIRKFRIVQKEGKRDISREVDAKIYFKSA